MRGRAEWAREGVTHITGTQCHLVGGNLQLELEILAGEDDSAPLPNAAALSFLCSQYCRKPEVMFPFELQSHGRLLGSAGAWQCGAMPLR